MKTYKIIFLYLYLFFALSSCTLKETRQKNNTVIDDTQSLNLPVRTITDEEKLPTVKKELIVDTLNKSSKLCLYFEENGITCDYKSIDDQKDPFTQKTYHLIKNRNIKEVYKLLTEFSMVNMHSLPKKMKSYKDYSENNDYPFLTQTVTKDSIHGEFLYAGGVTYFTLKSMEKDTQLEIIFSAD